MASRSCPRCQGRLSEGDYFCGQCGTPTKFGLKNLEKSGKLNMTLSQLDRAFQAGYVSKKKFEDQRAKYSAELAMMQDELAKKHPVEPNVFPPETDSPKPRSLERTFSDAKSAVIYADPPHLHLHDAVGYLIGAVVIVGLSLWFTWSLIGEGFETIWIEQWYLLLFSLVGPAIYLFWMWRADKFEREPLYFVFLILGWGMFAAFLSMIGNSIFDEIGLGAAWLGAPIVEESMKAIGVYLMAKSPEFNDSMDGMVYGFASGMGFAWAENFFYIVLIYKGNLTWALLRVFIFGLGHGIYTAYTGWAIGRAKVKKGYVTPGDMKIGLAMAIIAHGLYNSDLIQVDNYVSLAIWVLLTLGTFILILYALIRRSWAEEKKWLYDAGFAPKTMSKI